MLRLNEPTRTADIFCDHTEDRCLHLAVADIAGDIRKITGRAPTCKAFLPREETGYVLVGTASNPLFRALVESHGIDLRSLDNEWERYRIQTFGESGQNLLLCGSDERGAMWAVYEFAETFLGVDPVGFWTDNEPAARDDLSFGEIMVEAAPETFRYRGWFINDEDLLSEWKNGGGKRYITYRFYQQVVHQDAFSPVLETALRLKQNLMIPASFLDIDNPAEENLVRMAAERGLFVTQHHIEPLGVSHFSLENYWKKRGVETPPSFVTQREQTMETWTHYARKWAKYGNRVIWQLGLRGRGDSPVWVIDPNVPDTAEGRGATISDAIACQRQIVGEVLGRDDFVCTTTLWAEGTELHKAGHLTFPPETIVIFADNLRAKSKDAAFFAHQWAEDFRAVKRQPGLQYGIYYHVAVWGAGPHLAQGVPPEKIECCIRQAVEKGDTAYAITNVTNLREVVLGLRTVAGLTHNIDSFQLEAFLDDWCDRQFGPAAAEARSLYRDFHDAYAKVAAEDAPHPALIHDGVMAGFGSASLRGLFAQTNLKPCDDLLRRGRGKPDGPCAAPSPESILKTVRDISPLLTESLSRWRALSGRIRELARDIPRQRQSFFEHHFRVQAEIMTGLTEWALALGRAMELIQNGASRRETGAAVEEAAHAMLTLLTIRGQSERGRWRNWYRGDRKMDLNTLHRETRRLCEHLGSAQEF